MASPIWGGVYSSLFFGHLCMAHSLVKAGEICRVRQDGNQSMRNLRRPRSCATFPREAVTISGVDRSVHWSWRYLPTTRDIYEPIVRHLGDSGEIVKHGHVRVPKCICSINLPVSHFQRQSSRPLRRKPTTIEPPESPYCTRQPDNGMGSSRRADEGSYCGAPEIQCFAENTPRRADVSKSIAPLA